MVLDYEGTANGLECPFDLAHVGAVPSVEQFADGVLAELQSSPQVGVRDSLFMHGSVNYKFRGSNRRHRDQDLSFGHGARVRDLLMPIDIETQGD